MDFPTDRYVRQRRVFATDIEGGDVEYATSQQIRHLTEATAPIEQSPGRNPFRNLVRNADVVPDPDWLVQVREVAETLRLASATGREQEFVVVVIALVRTHEGLGGGVEECGRALSD